MWLPKGQSYRKGERVPGIARGGCCLRRLLFLSFMVVLIFGAYFLYSRRDEIGPPLQEGVEGLLGQLEASYATLSAPTATPAPSLSIMTQRADQVWQDGFIEEAVDQYRELLETFPAQASIHQRLARGQLALVNTLAGQESAQLAIAADPYAAQGWALAALALLQDDQPTAALASALHALSLDDDYGDAQVFLAQAYADLGQNERAFAIVDEVLAKDERQAEALHLRGQLYAEVRFDFAAARQDLQLAHDLMPQWPTYAFSLAVHQMLRLDEYDEALATLLAILDRNPNHRGVLYWLGFLFNTQLGNPGRAAEYLNRCVVASPNSRECLFYLGRMQKDQLGQFAEAAVHLERVIEIGTEDPRVYYHAADAHRNLGECARALPLIEKGSALAREQDYQQIYENIFADFDFLLNECRAAVG